MTRSRLMTFLAGFIMGGLAMLGIVMLSSQQPRELEIVHAGGPTVPRVKAAPKPVAPKPAAPKPAAPKPGPKPAPKAAAKAAVKLAKRPVAARNKPKKKSKPAKSGKAARTTRKR